MAGVAGLRVRLGDDGADEEVDDRALASPGPADHGHVQGRFRLAIEERADDVANQGGREPELAGVAGQGRLAAAVVLQPGQIAGEQTDELSVIRGVHQPAPGLDPFYPTN